MINDEERRLAEVSKYLELDFNRSSEFQDIVELAAKLCDKPLAMITFLGEEFNWLKVKYGTDVEVMPRETSFCQYAIAQDNLLIVGDASKDLRFIDNSLVHENPKLRFYAGAPLILKNGLKLGTLCLFDLKSNDLTEMQQNVLSMLSRQVTFLMELEMGKKLLQQQIDVAEARNESLIKIAQLQSHQIRQPLTTIMGLVDLVTYDKELIDDEWLSMFKNATNNFNQTIVSIVAESVANKDLRVIRFNKMVQEIDDYAFLLLDETGNVENWNKGAEKIKGYSSQEVLGRNFSIFYTDEQINEGRPEKLISEAGKTGVARDEGWRVRKDGKRFWGSIVITAIYSQEGKVIGFTKVTRDLTDIEDAKDAKKVSVDMFNLMMQQTDKSKRVGGWELNLKNNELSWTSVTKEIHGVDEEYIPQLSTAINFYKEGKSRVMITNAIEIAVSNGTPWELELELVTAGNEQKWVHTLGKSNYKDGVCTKVYGTLRDITTETMERMGSSLPA
ncbi:MAG: PAS domain S-box protein [Pedobacter sp.]|nr:PAS domain S-box protein [Pedobacter sp.]